MTLAAIMDHERRALMTEYLFPSGIMGGVQVPPYCAVRDFADLKDTPAPLRDRHPVLIDPLLGKKPGQAIVEECLSLDFRFLWVHVDNDDYRADYVTFLRTRHGLMINALPSDLHVD